MKKAVKTILSLPVLGLAMLVGAQSSMALTQIEATKLIAGAVIYDNEMGVAEDADPTAPIISGSIVIH